MASASGSLLLKMPDTSAHPLTRSSAHLQSLSCHLHPERGLLMPAPCTLRPDAPTSGKRTLYPNPHSHLHPHPTPDQLVHEEPTAAAPQSVFSAPRPGFLSTGA